MGCPDWPTCFGSWIPPTSVSELPADYKETYTLYRQKKNEKFARYLGYIGLDEIGQRIVNDPDVRIESDFNVVKTWTEYINRLVGVVIGLLIIGMFLRALPLYGQSPEITIIAGLTLILVIIQGWFGSIVVSSNLTHWTITVHMLLAIVMVLMIVYLLHISNPKEDNTVQTSKITLGLLIGSGLTLLLQTLLGTEIRGSIDELYQSAIGRNDWIANLGLDFVIHRSFSWVVLLIHIGFWYKIRKTKQLKSSALALILIILGAVMSGAGMAYFNVPSFLQPVHLLLATLAFGIQYMMYLRLKVDKEVVKII